MANPTAPGPWRVFLSHTSELRQYPSGGSYIDKAERAISAAGHAVVDMRDFPSIDEAPAQVCIDRVNGCDVYVGIYGTRWGSPVRDRPEVSYTELEFDTATATKGTDRPMQRLVFLLDEDGEDLGIPPKALIDRKYADKQQAFLQKVKGAGLTLQKFANPDQLSQLVERSLKELAAGAAPSPTTPSYTPADLDAWVERHHQVLEQAFGAIPSVQQRRVHVPLDVRLTPAGAAGSSEPMLLQPEHLQPLLADGASHVLLISGDGGTGKTSLAFRIARWLLEGKPGDVRRLPLLIETALGEGESVADRAAAWLKAQLGESSGEGDGALVEALLRFKRLIPILDHVSELPEAARQRAVRNLPPGLVIATSRSVDDGYRERPLSRIEPLQIATDRLQSFFLDYLRQRGQGEALRDDDLVPAQNQLRRIVGDKPITALLAQMFIDDVIAKRQQGLLAGSVPELMLSYVKRVDTPSDPRMRQRAGLTIDGAMVQKALKVLALASHRQESPQGQPRFQPLVFPTWLAERALAAADGMALEQAEQRRALLGYLVALRLLHHPGADDSELRFPLDPLADYLAALRQLERLEADSAGDGSVWQGFLADLEGRSVEERELMRGFLLALRDCCRERSKGRALAMPSDAPDRLGRLGFLDPEEERHRLALQRARKWMWELGVPVASERRDAIAKLAAMAAAGAEAGERRAVRTVASRRLALALRDGELPIEERCEAATVLGLIGEGEASAALEQVMVEEGQPVEVRRAAAEALGLGAAGRECRDEHRQRIEAALEQRLRAMAVDVLVEDEAGWDRVDAVLPLLQGEARGLQLAMAADLPQLASGEGRVVPMLTLTALEEGKGLRVRSKVVEVPVWRLPLPGGEQLEMVVVSGGDYGIGSPEEEAGRDVYPRVRERCEGVNVEAERIVRLESIAMARFPISQAQWRAVAGLPLIERDLNPTPGSFKSDGLWERHAQPGGLAVDSVSWFDCGEWLARLNRWLSEQWADLSGGGEAPQLALPSESQWEVACRAGSRTPFHFGDTLVPSWANFDGNYTYGRGRKGTYRQRPTTIGAFGLVNSCGLAEMHGQLYEWCGDRWHPDPVGPDWRQDGSAWEEPDPALEGSGQQVFRLLRGGCWITVPHGCRAAYRGSNRPDDDDSNVGVRPCCSLPPGLVLGP